MNIEKEEFLAALKFAFSNGFMNGAMSDCRITDYKYCFKFKEINEKFDELMNGFFILRYPEIKSN